MADIAADYAVALGPAFGEPVDVLGISTGGSVAQQFALDHPRLLRRLVLAGAAHRLGPVAREAQRRSAEFAESGDYRRSLAAAPTLVGSRAAQPLLGTAFWLMAPLARMGKNWDPSDMIATIRAEDAFDVAGRLGEVRAPTLLIAGDRDLNFGMGLFERTAALIPDCRFVVYGATTAGRKARGGTRTGSGAPGGSYSRPRIRSSAPRSWTAATASLSFGTGPAQRTGRE
jgi:pimeloyl-ACP methyl ester carboxylesterase